MADIFRVSKDINQAIQEIVRKINEIERKLLVKPNTGVTTDSQGAIGSQRVETIDDVTTMKVKTKDGWKSIGEKATAAFLTGNGIPANSLGKIGDTYLDINTKILYVKDISGWL